MPNHPRNPQEPKTSCIKITDGNFHSLFITQSIHPWTSSRRSANSEATKEAKLPWWLVLRRVLLGVTVVPVSAVCRCSVGPVDSAGSSVLFLFG